jgi:hypothetical protein
MIIELPSDVGPIQKLDQRRTPLRLRRHLTGPGPHCNLTGRTPLFFSSLPITGRTCGHPTGAILHSFPPANRASIEASKLQLLESRKARRRPQGWLADYARLA